MAPPKLKTPPLSILPKLIPKLKPPQFSTKLNLQAKAGTGSLRQAWLVLATPLLLPKLPQWTLFGPVAYATGQQPLILLRARKTLLRMQLQQELTGRFMEAWRQLFETTLEPPLLSPAIPPPKAVLPIPTLQLILFTWLPYERSNLNFPPPTELVPATVQFVFTEEEGDIQVNRLLAAPSQQLSLTFKWPPKSRVETFILTFATIL